MAIPAERPARAERQRRDPEATREALLRAASEQFAEAGYEGASLSRILERVGLTKGALYHHFTNKEEIAEAIIEESIARKHLVGRTAFEAAPDPLSGLVAAITVALELSLADPVVHGGDRLLDDPQIPVARATENYRLAAGRVVGMVRAAAEAGLLRDGVDPDLVTSLIVALATGNRLIAERTDATDRLPARMAEAWRGLLPVIATDEWLGGHPLTRP
jgi:TetR/AcrR family transcriptional regulator, repressor for uid operon